MKDYKNKFVDSGGYLGYFVTNDNSTWHKLSERVPTVEEDGEKVLCYLIKQKVVDIFLVNTLEFESNFDYRKENILWQKIPLPKGV